jgi:hypothetical protein
MILSNTSRWTHRCPLARLSAVRWTLGMVSSILWLRTGFAELERDEMLWTLLAAMIATQAFGTLSSGMLMLRPRVGIVARLTDWYGIVASVIIWVIALGAAVSIGVSWLQAALLFSAVATGVLWLGMIHFGLRPIRLGAIGRE